MTILSRAALTSILLAGLFHAEVQADGGLANPSDPVTITDVQVRISDHGAVVLLLAEGKAIPIFVDLTVALSIQGALNGEKLSRPLSHDLMHTILEAYGGKVLRTVITLQGGTYYGALTVAVQDQVKTFHRGTRCAELGRACVWAIEGGRLVRPILFPFERGAVQGAFRWTA